MSSPQQTSNIRHPAIAPSGKKSGDKFSWGGARAGAGRKNIKGEGSHLKRPKIAKTTPTLVTLKLKTSAPHPRRQEFFDLFRDACSAAREFGIRIHAFHFVRREISLIVECRSNMVLTQAMKSLCIRLSKNTNKNLRRKRKPSIGSIFAKRFELELLASEHDVISAYHRMFIPNKIDRHLMTDPYSSALFVPYWNELLGARWKSHFATPSQTLIEQRKKNFSNFMNISSRKSQASIS